MPQAHAYASAISPLPYAIRKLYGVSLFPALDLLDHCAERAVCSTEDGWHTGSK
jgi:hypothetical protein